MENKKIVIGVLATPTPNGTKVERAEFTDTLDGWHEALGCDCIDIQDRRVLGSAKHFDFVLDDEGLYKPMPMPSCVTVNASGLIIEHFVGKVAVVRHDRNGNLVSLTEDEVAAVMSSVRRAGALKFLAIRL
ncbi:MAG: hypothetical protein LKG11_00775 [Bacilli bacterium]|jgi:hypothetical protein|nr:hypothetical protein [Bacilli bacterium]